MTEKRKFKKEPGSLRLLVKCALLSLFIEFAIFQGLSLKGHWMVHESAKSPQTLPFLEAEIYEAPQLEKPRLYSEKSSKRPEKVISRKPHTGPKAEKPREAPPEEEVNQTEEGPPPVPPTHDPIALYKPDPTIPDYLRDKEFKTAIVVDFYVEPSGVTTPKLVNSTGNEELDAHALEELKKWRFAPAEKDHQPIPGKIRSRVYFVVD